jgi:putative spermidine/putrescine transport system ATP-binding protein
MAYLELRNLRRAFGPVVALDDIEIGLEQGEFLSLLGPSGCGKTTALRLVAGFDRPDAGTIVVDGKDVTRTPPNRRDMGMVFQAYSLFPNMTAMQNVEYGLRVRRKDKTQRRKRAQELLELVGLGHAVDRFPHQLSGGMQQRVAGRWRSSRACSCSTSRSPRSTRRCACSYARRSGASSSSSGSRRSTSRTTRRRRSRSPTTSP